MDYLDLVNQAKLVICYPQKDGVSLRKRIEDITQDELDAQWNILNELQASVPAEMLVMQKNYELMLSGVDEEIRDLVDVLNKNGYKTVASCSGHGKKDGNIALVDGRELIIVGNFERARRIERLIVENETFLECE